MIENRIDFVLLFDVVDGNPNGDPEMASLPRTDPETGQGLVTDVALKRRIRNYVTLARRGTPGYEIYVRDGAVLNRQHEKAYAALGHAPQKSAKLSEEDHEAITRWMCANFYDIRTFGAVMTTGVNAGQVRGPVQLTFARSIDPILPIDMAITRVAVTSEEQAARQVRNHTMGRKSIVPYAIYRAHGFISPSLARRTGFGDADQELLFEGLMQMFEHDRTAARGMMSTRQVVAFRHDGPLGCAPAASLFDRVTVERAGTGAGRSFRDYNIAVDRTCLPSGVACQLLL